MRDRDGGPRGGSPLGGGCGARTTPLPAPAPPRSYYALADAMPPTPEYKDTTRLEPFSSAARTAAVVAGYPKVAAIIANVAANANLQKYLAARPASSF